MKIMIYCYVYELFTQFFEKKVLFLCVFALFDYFFVNMKYVRNMLRYL